MTPLKKEIPDTVKKDLCLSFLKRVPEMKVIPFSAYKNAKTVLRLLAEKEKDVVA